VRVTDRLVFDRSARDLARARAAAEEARAAVSSGRSVSHPGDDPATAGAVAAFAMSSARSAALARAADLAGRELEAADGALERVADALSRAGELAVRFASAGYAPGERAAGAAEVATLRASVVASLNTRLGNRWLFGGARDDAPPFGVDGAWAGDAGARELEVAPGVMQATAIRADVAVKGAGGGVDVFATLTALEAALRADDPAAVRATLGGLEASLTQVAGARGEAGVAMDALAAAGEASRLVSDDEQVQLAERAGADLVESSLRLAQAQQALEASIQAAATGMSLSLLDRLR
jgi:flagellar hook-associated protein 3 FlgL